MIDHSSLTAVIVAYNRKEMIKWNPFIDEIFVGT